ncbi:hypothetical protein [Flagellimonas nanhaiensis]|uniref:Uncharacterized protein n=1 Tax=Flagellimonas nanhaiensis TaxID=2292706 RepID=A0A371JPE9_9FLAO|nr:hypothetical protein [Allomuricauda nanhaiensis]RDY59387.1 hypothetical protein DX873_08345 [Allomuricauda nanhaiensis]
MTIIHLFAALNTDIPALLIAILSLGYAFYTDRKVKRQELRLQFAEALQELSGLNAVLLYEVMNSKTILHPIRSLIEKKETTTAVDINELKRSVEQHEDATNKLEEVAETNNTLVKKAWGLQKPNIEMIVGIRKAISLTDKQIQTQEHYNRKIAELKEVFQEYL